MWALVILGGQGIGKSFFAEILMSMVGQDNVNLPTNEQIHEKYTDWQKKCQIVVIEELMAIGRRELMNKLKPVITQTTTMIRELFGAYYRYPNRFNIIAFTNYEDALILDKDDRRYAILKSDTKPQSTTYYNELWSWAEDTKNIQHLLHFFLNRDLSAFNAHGRAPLTSAKRQMIEMSRTDLEAWIEDSISDKAWPFNGEVVATSHLKDLEACPYHFKSIADNVWSKAFIRCGAFKYGKQIPLSNGRKLNVWLIGDNKEELGKLPAKEIAKIYEADSTSAENEHFKLIAELENF